jgi:hypothetical protein
MGTSGLSSFIAGKLIFMIDFLFLIILWWEGEKPSKCNSRIIQFLGMIVFNGLLVDWYNNG